MYITMTSQWARWRLKSPASPLFTQPFIGAQIKENIKAPRHWPLCGEFTGEFPTQMASNAKNVFIWWSHHEKSEIYHFWTSAQRSSLTSDLTFRPNSHSQIPQCTCPISHNALFRTEMCTFLFRMVHWGISDRYIVGFERVVYWGSVLGLLF